MQSRTPSRLPPCLQVRQEMEQVVLKEMRAQLEEVYRRVGQEEAARKLVRGKALPPVMQ